MSTNGSQVGNVEADKPQKEAEKLQELSESVITLLIILLFKWRCI